LDNIISTIQDIISALWNTVIDFVPSLDSEVVVKILIGAVIILLVAAVFWLLKRE
jgi:hypothetical protein